MLTVRGSANFTKEKQRRNITPWLATLEEKPSYWDPVGKAFQCVSQRGEADLLCINLFGSILGR